MATESGMAEFYNESYKRRNYFRYPTWIYGPYISSLISFCGLKRGDSVLDIGCGQGFFSYLFSKEGMKVYGIDISEVGIRTAESLYKRLDITFAVSDVKTATFAEQFDCVFVRSCSLYNSVDFPLRAEVTENFLRHLKVGGIFIFAYNSTLSSKPSLKWQYHSLEDIQRHFSGYPNAEFFFLNKMTTCVLRKYSFNPFVTRLNSCLTRILGVGGDLVCVLKKTAWRPVVSRRTSHTEAKKLDGERSGKPSILEGPRLYK